MNARRSLALLLLVVATSAAPALHAQELPPDRSSRPLEVAPAHEAPVEPRTIAPDADFDVLEAFHRDLDGLSEASWRRARIERARRVADFDLDRGLE